jgi:hypothetical protein
MDKMKGEAIPPDVVKLNEGAASLRNTPTEKVDIDRLVKALSDPSYKYPAGGDECD